MASRRVTEPSATATHHHSSHRGLLHNPRVRFPREVDAIVVPTMRNVATLRAAVHVANKLDATLVTLCSKWSSAFEVASFVRGKGIKLVAVDVDDLPRGVIPSFDTCRVLAGTRFERRTDTSLKRNLGLLLARLIGWKRIVFLDDDIEIPEPMDLRDAAGLTDRYAGVGLRIAGMPDNSVVCHAFREAGGPQDTFIGGGALVVGTRSAATSFFPNIYNEDWFFLLDDNGLRPTATTGRAIQKDYDPYREDRARKEELGDCLAEGLFWLLDNGRSLQDATAEHWQTFLANRADFITDVIGMVGGMDGNATHRHRMLLSLKEARGRCQYIKPELCVRYVDAWRADRKAWRRHLDTVHRNRRRLRTLDEVGGLFRSLDFSDRSVRLDLPA
jgi:glycosyltransferase involved in cell wall biosynthesis